jgi:riboflavin kinase/FMN adenylyltransferase
MEMLRFSTILKSSEITSVAIGGFDGMHLGHMELVKKLDENGVLLVIDKKNSNLTPDGFRCRYVKNGCVFLELDSIKHLTKDEFIEFLKKSFPSLKKVVVGYDFRFGKDREGSSESLGKEFEVVTVSEVKVDGISVHTNVIREALKKDISLANKLLGREYEVFAKSVKGQGIGTKELVPTINLETIFLLPKSGVYATVTKIDTVYHDSISFIGHRQTTDGKFAFETHLLDVIIDCPPKTLEVRFVDFIRDNKKFDTIKALRYQIGKDIKRRRKS